VEGVWDGFNYCACCSQTWRDVKLVAAVLGSSPLDFTSHLFLHIVSTVNHAKRLNFNLRTPSKHAKMLDTPSTLYAGYVFYSLCLLLIVIRLYLTRTRNHEWRSDDYWTMLALVILVLRIVVIQYVLDDQTNNNITDGKHISAKEMQERILGSKMVLLARACYAIFVWCMKFCVLALYKQIVGQVRQYRQWLKPMWCLLMATLVGSLLSTFLECRPFRMYCKLFF
jgi:uncharacterized membrane protein YhaH (DUF805 family)